MSDEKKEALKDRLRLLIKEAASQHRVRKTPSRSRRMRIEVENVSLGRVVIVIDRGRAQED